MRRYAETMGKQSAAVRQRMVRRLRDEDQLVDIFGNLSVLLHNDLD
jgi:hypothetical protein